MQQRKSPPPKSLFCAAARLDKPFLERWETHLVPLQRAGHIVLWSELHLTAGMHRMQEHQEHLDQANLILLLISADFFSDDDSFALMERALQRPRANAAVVIPLLLQPCSWKDTAIGTLECLPASGIPITQWQDREEAWHNCVQDIRRRLGLPPLPSIATQVHSETQPDPERKRMLRRLASEYNRQLKQSLQGAPEITLELADKPGAVQRAVILSLPIATQAEYPFPTDATIAHAYDSAGERLLILGGMGTGKSTLLLRLAQYLVDQANKDETNPMPIILPLSTWANKRPALADWISEQFSQIYTVPPKLSQQWVQQNQILPLLDGLDEIKETARLACVTAINKYHQAHLTPLVVCSRTRAYETIAEKERLTLQDAVMVLPLKHELVDEHLMQAGKPFTSYSLQDLLVMTPLTLRFLMSIDQETITQTLSQNEKDLQSLFAELYIRQQLGVSRMSAPYTEQQTRTWLIFLAQQMRDHNQAIFYLEHLQPDWFPGEQERFSQSYHKLATRGVGIFLGALMGLSVNAVIFGGDQLAFDLIYGLLGGLTGELISGEDTPGFHLSAIINTLKRQWRSFALPALRNGFFVSVLVSLAFLVWPSDGSHEALIYGCGTGICSLLLTLIIPAGKVAEDQDAQPRTFIQRRWNALIPQELKTDHCKLGLLIGLIIGLSFGISVGLSKGLSNGYAMSVGLSAGLSNGLSTGLTIGLSYTAIGILLCLALLGKKSTIKLVELLVWSRQRFGRQLISKNHLSVTLGLFLLIICIFGFGVGISIGQETGWNAGIMNGLRFGLGAGLSVSLAYWTLFGLWTGMSSEILGDDDRRKPNQGIRRSLQRALLVGSLAGSLCILVGLPNEMLYYALHDGLSKGFSEGLSAMLRDIIFIECFGALLPALLAGGITVIRHYLLRIFLWQAKLMPLDTTRFLDDATHQELLEKIGGGYRFRHHLYLDYFANQELP